MPCSGCGENELPIGPPGQDGQDGQDGIDGTNGQDGTNWAFQLTTLAPDPAGCVNGGTLVQIGPDANFDGIIDNGAVTQSFVICNGEDGRPGPSGTPVNGIIMFDGDMTLGGINFDANGIGTGDLDGWVLCDRTDNITGQIDLRGRFIVGVGVNQTPSANEADNTNYALGVGDSGGFSIGKNKYALAKGEIPAHKHNVNGSAGDGATIQIVSSGGHAHSYVNWPDQSGGIGGGGGGATTNNIATPQTTGGTGNHVHGNGSFIGNVGNGTLDGLKNPADAHENRPPWYALGYIKRVS